MIKEVTLLAERASASSAPPAEAFAIIARLAYAKAGRPALALPEPTTALPAPPRLTEDWFC